MVGLRFLEPFILVRVQVPQQSSLVLNDQEGSEQTDNLYRHRIPAESSIQEHKTTLTGGFMLIFYK